MNWEGYERKRSWPDYRYYLSIYPKGQRKITKILSGQPISGLRFQAWSCLIRNRRAKYSAVMLGKAHSGSDMIAIL
jgi:hypothetical protein